MAKSKHLEAIFWSIAFPGFGQFLNGKFLIGATLLLLEFLINNQSKLNLFIISSFRGEIDAAVNEVNYQWLMFYPCVYLLFAIWDACAMQGVEMNPIPFSFLFFQLKPNLKDFFLYSGKYQPQMYLNPKVRGGISTFANICDAFLISIFVSIKLGNIINTYYIW